MAREVNVTIIGILPLDAVKAVANQVELTERAFERSGLYNASTNKHGVKDVKHKSLLKTGATVFLTHEFSYTLIASAGKYTFMYVKSYPDAQAKIEDKNEPEVTE